MRKIIFAALISIVASGQGMAQPSAGTVGPAPSSPPCVSFGTSSGTCAQGNDSRIVSAAQIQVGGWTPVPAGDGTAGAVTCGTATGRYIKFSSTNGNYTIVDFKLICTGAGTMTGNLTVTGLPTLAVAAADGDCNFHQVDGITLAATNSMITGTIFANTSLFYVYNISAVGPTASTLSQQAITGLPVGSWTLNGQCRYQSQ